MTAKFGQTADGVDRGTEFGCLGSSMISAERDVPISFR